MKVVSDEGMSEAEGDADKKIEKINEWFKFVLNCSHSKKCFHWNIHLYIYWFDLVFKGSNHFGKLASSQQGVTVSSSLGGIPLVSPYETNASDPTGSGTLIGQSCSSFCQS